MKRTGLFLCLIIVFFGCNTSKKIHNNDKPDKPEDKLVGTWTEHWFTDASDSESDVNYVDTIKINLKNDGQINIRCLNNKNYAYSKIQMMDQVFSFEMENKVDPNEKFTIQYTLRLVKETELNGEILNSRGKKVKIRLKKIK